MRRLLDLLQAWLRSIPLTGGRRSWHTNAIAVVRLHWGPLRLTWPLPLFVVEDLLLGLLVYAWLWPLTRPAARLGWRRLWPAWRRLRWSGARSLLAWRDVLSLRLI